MGIIASCQYRERRPSCTLRSANSGSLSSAVFRAVGVFLFGLFGRHYVLELRPKTFDLAELISNLATYQLVHGL